MAKSSTSNISENEYFQTVVEMNKTITKLTVLLEQRNSALEQRDRQIAELLAKVDELTRQLLEYQQMMQDLTGQIRILTNEKFGTTSEKRSSKSDSKKEEDNSEEQKKNKKDKDGNDDQNSGNGSSSGPAKSDAEIRREYSRPKPDAKRKPKKTVEEKMAEAGITPEVVVHKLTEEDLILQGGNTEMTIIGSKHAYYSIEFIPAKLKVIDHRVEVAAPKNKVYDDSLPFDRYPIHAEPPKQMLAGCWVTPALISMVITMKMLFQIPANRIRTILNTLGGYVPTTSTICDWIIKTSQKYFAPLYRHLKKLLLKESHLQADETTLRVINESWNRRKSKSFLWQYRTAESALKKIVLYDYTYTRGGANAARFLKDFNGSLTVDGFTGYNLVKGVKLTYCWVHARRYFIEAIIAGRDEKVAETAEKVLDYIDRIFILEGWMKNKGLDADERRRLRHEETLPIVEELFEWVHSLDIPSLMTEKLRRAFNYLLNHEEGLKVFLEDPYVPAENNSSERAFIPVARGRHNWLFAYSEEGAEALATLFSITRTAQENGLNVEKYLTHVIEVFQEYRDTEIPEEAFDQVLPWNEQIMATCA